MPRLAPKLPLKLRWGGWWRQGRPPQPGEGRGAPQEDPLLAVGRLLRQQREAEGLSLRQLAQDTRISTPVLEALERGWRDRLPEGAYLRTMLPLLEHRLQLPGGSLEGALPPQASGQQRPGGRQGLLQRFTPGSIDVFSTWQGTLLYGGLTLALIYGLNLQQQQLAAANLLSLRPVAPLPLAEQQRPEPAGSTLLAAYPELRPLQRAGRGWALELLQRQGAPAGSSSGPGVLQLNLAQPSRLQLSSESGPRSNLQGATGELVLQLQPPLQLELQPAPAPGAVLWNGAALAPLAGQPGRFQLPAPRTPEPQSQAGPRP